MVGRRRLLGLPRGDAEGPTPGRHPVRCRLPGAAGRAAQQFGRGDAGRIAQEANTVNNQRERAGSPNRSSRSVFAFGVTSALLIVGAWGHDPHPPRNMDPKPSRRDVHRALQGGHPVRCHHRGTYARHNAVLHPGTASGRFGCRDLSARPMAVQHSGSTVSTSRRSTR